MGVKIGQPHRARPRNARESRRAILSAAEAIFARAGLAGARTDAIADAAGVNKALIYYYFKSKQRLYEAVVEDHFKAFNDKALAILTADGSPRELLLEYVSMHFDFISQRHRHAALHQQIMAEGGKLLKRLVPKYFLPRGKALGALLERGVKEGQFRNVDRFHTAASIVGLIVFYFSAAPVLELLGHTDAYSPANLRRRKQEVLDFIRFGLFSDREGNHP
jgi:TetR/AcrR family transcriptional regulator